MAGLSDGAYRRKITIDNTNIDSDLTHFPIPIILGTSVGQDNQDLTHIFDTLGPSSQKIAITKDDGTTELYVEIEHWKSGTVPGEKGTANATRNLGSSDDGAAGLSSYGSPTDNGSYYTFDGSSTGLYSSSNLGDTSTEVVWAKIRIHDKNKGTAQVIWKDGAARNGVAVGIDASGNLGIFGVNNESPASAISIPPEEYSNDVWYEVYFTRTRVSIVEAGTGNIVATATGNCVTTNGDGIESIAHAADDSPFTLTHGSNIEFFDGDIDSIEIYTEGELTAPYTEQASAVLWVSKSDLTVASASTTTLYLYYDITKDNNTTYVGDIGDAVAQNVWDSNFLRVYHNGCGTDSTGNLDTTNYGSFTVGGATGKVGNATEFDGSNDRAESGTLQHNNGTISGWIKTDHTPTNSNYRQAINSAYNIVWDHANGGSWPGSFAIKGDSGYTISFGTLSANTWYHLQGTYDGSTAISYKNGSQENTENFSESIESKDVFIGADANYADGSSHHFGGFVDEARISDTARSAAWIKADYYAQTDDLLTFSGYETSENVGGLSDGAYRRKITIDNTNIDSNLTHFPIPIILGTSVGQDNQDLTHIFDTLGSDSQKIAVTKDDGITQLYVEIENWDNANEEAVLWVSKDTGTLSSSADNYIYLYYDSSKSDNTTYVADAGSRTEVWDSNFLRVFHLGESSGAAIDSTGNENGTYNGTLPDAIDAQIGKGQTFNGTSDYVNIGSSVLNNLSALTIQSYIKSSESSAIILSDSAYAVSYNSVNLATHRFACNGSNGTADRTNMDFSSDQADGTWNFVVGTGDGSDLRGYVDGSLDVGPTAHASGIWNSSADAALGSGSPDGTSQSYFAIDLDELRISDTARSADGIKADYYAQTDDLLTFGAEETIGLSDGAYRLKITIDNTNIDSDLTHFPVCVILSSSAGTSGQDVTTVFDTLGPNSQKIAVTKDDGITQLYVEIEDWDDSNEEAVLWVSKSDFTVSSGSITTFYLYYDSSKSDNTTYVGNTGDAVAQNVWDSDYGLVSHDGGLNDSTSNANNGTNYSSDTISGIIGDGRFFDASNNERVQIESQAAIDWLNDFDTEDRTIQCYYNNTDTSSKYGSIFGVADTDDSPRIRVFSYDAAVSFNVTDDSGNSVTAQDNGSIASNNGYWICTTGNTSAGEATLRVDTLPEETGTNGSIGTISQFSSSEYLTIGASNEAGTINDLAADVSDVYIDELRISNTLRSASWRKADYYSVEDDLISFEFEIYDEGPTEYTETAEDGILFSDDIETEIQENLPGGSTKTELTIPASKIDSDLTHFAVPVNIGSDSGITNEDVTYFFEQMRTEASVTGDPTEKGEGSTAPLIDDGIQLTDSFLEAGNKQPNGEDRTVYATKGFSSGKYYGEIYVESVYTTDLISVGVADKSLSNLNYNFRNANIFAQYTRQVNGDPGNYTYIGQIKSTNWNSSTGIDHQETGDVIGIAVDADAGDVGFSLNGVWQNGTPSTGSITHSLGLSGTLYPVASLGTFQSNTLIANFGGTEFVHDIPSGFSRLDSGYDNRKRVAFTKDDGITELYAEIENYDSTRERATYGISKSDGTLSSTEDTNFGLYYDASHSINSAYIGDTTESVAQNVGIHDRSVGLFSKPHKFSIESDSIKDSTSEANHGTFASDSALTLSNIGYSTVGRSFDGKNTVTRPGIADIGDLTTATLSNGFQIDLHFKPENVNGIILESGDLDIYINATTNKIAVDSDAETIATDSNGLIEYINSTDGESEDGVTLSLYSDGTSGSLLVNNTEDGSGTLTSPHSLTNVNLLNDFGGEIAYLSIHNSDLGSAGRTAFYYAMNDALVTFSSSESTSGNEISVVATDGINFRDKAYRRAGDGLGNQYRLKISSNPNLISEPLNNYPGYLPLTVLVVPSAGALDRDYNDSTFTEGTRIDTEYGTFGGESGLIINNGDDIVETNSATSLQVSGDDAGSSATLRGTLKSLEEEDFVGVYFEYGTDTSYGNTTSIQVFNTVSTSFNDDVLNLPVPDTYHFRAVATDRTGYNGNDVTLPEYGIGNGSAGSSGNAGDDDTETNGGIGSTSGWLGQDFGTQKVIGVYILQAARVTGFNREDRAPRDGTFEGSNDLVSWDILDSQTGKSGDDYGVSNTTYLKKLDTTGSYRYYRINISSNSGHSDTTVREASMYEVDASYGYRTGYGQDDTFDLYREGHIDADGIEFKTVSISSGSTKTVLLTTQEQIEEMGYTTIEVSSASMYTALLTTQEVTGYFGFTTFEVSSGYKI